MVRHAVGCPSNLSDLTQVQAKLFLQRLPDSALEHYKQMELVRLQIVPARARLQASHESQVVYLLLTTRTPRSPRPATDLNLCLVVDRSAWIDGEQLDIAKAGLRHVARQLSNTDKLSLVTFNDRAEVIVPLQPLQNMVALHRAVDHIYASGEPVLAQGLTAGLQQLEHASFEGVQRLLLFISKDLYSSDQQCVKLLCLAQQQGIGLTAISIGTDLNSTFYEQSTVNVDNRIYAVASLGDSISALDSEVARLRATAARNVTLTITTSPAMELRTLYRIQPFVMPLVPLPLGNNKWQVKSGDLVLDEAPVFLLKLAIRAIRPNEEVVVRVDVRYAMLETPHYQNSACATARLSAVTDAESLLVSDVRKALEQVVAHQIRQYAQRASITGQLEAVAKHLQTAVDHLLSTGEIDLAQIILAETRSLLPNNPSRETKNKQVKHSSVLNGHRR